MNLYCCAAVNTECASRIPVLAIAFGVCSLCERKGLQGQPTIAAQAERKHACRLKSHERSTGKSRKVGCVASVVSAYFYRLVAITHALSSQGLADDAHLCACCVRCSVFGVCSQRDSLFTYCRSHVSYASVFA